MSYKIAHLISSQSLNLGGRRGTTDDVATIPFHPGERGGSVVECRTPEREVRGSRPTAAVLCPWARHFTPRKYWLITQEAMAPSRHDWKIVDWDVKPQHNQPFHPPGNLQTPFPSIPWCYLPISSSVFLSFLLLSLSLAELSSPCQRILRCGHTIWVSVSLPW